MSDAIVTAPKGRDLFAALDKNGFLAHGTFIPSAFVRSVLCITLPEVGTKQEFDQASLAEMAAIDYVRNILLDAGKYLSGVKDGYRILLPSENAGQVAAYMRSADKKLRRALKLHKGTVGEAQLADQTSARIMLKQSGLRSQAGSLR